MDSSLKYYLHRLVKQFNSIASFIHHLHQESVYMISLRINLITYAYSAAINYIMDTGHVRFSKQKLRICLYFLLNTRPQHCSSPGIICTVYKDILFPEIDV